VNETILMPIFGIMETFLWRCKTVA